jgi:GR25 family glycosyltransferase involved in LPS biosynthesis
MRCVYINLDRDVVRRRNIEQSFAVANAKAPHWTLERYPAVDIKYVSEHATPGCIAPAEKGCFLSHKHIMQHYSDQTESLFITEDDAVFSPDTLAILEGLLNKIDGVVEWDLLFTDVGIPAIGVMADLLAMTYDIFRKGSIELANLGQLSRLYGATSFYGSTAYVINHKSIPKILGLMGDDPLDLPYDLFLRSMISEGMINAHVTLPFITTVSDDGLSSSIQQSEYAKTDLVWNLFRKMVWLEGGDFDPTAVLNKMLNEIDPRSRQFGALWAIMCDPSFKLK